MGLLIAGVLLWSLAHLFKRLAPGARASMGNAGKGLVALLVLASVWLMYMGYGSAENVYFWTRNPALAGINNLLMLFAVYFMVISYIPTKLRAKILHPQLTAVKTWALAHLIVNGDMNSFILFGGLLAWAVVSVILINKQSRPAKPEISFSFGRELAAVLITVVAYGAIAMAHMKLGYPVFG